MNFHSGFNVSLNKITFKLQILHKLGSKDLYNRMGLCTLHNCCVTSLLGATLSMKYLFELVVYEQLFTVKSSCFMLTKSFFNKLKLKQN